MISSDKGSTSAVNLLGIELRAEDSGAKQIAIIELVGAVVAFIGGVFLLSSKKRVYQSYDGKCWHKRA